MTFTHEGNQYLTRAHKTTLNRVTAWWDASQIYGYNDLSWKRVKRDPQRSGEITARAGQHPCARSDGLPAPCCRPPITRIRSGPARSPWLSRTIGTSA